MASSNFPRFNDGNVEIYFSETDDKYVLHSHVLALHSTFFKASLSERWNAGGETTLINGKHQWVYELRFDKGQSLGMLTRRGSNPTETEFVSGLVEELPSDAPEARKAAAEMAPRRLMVIRALKDMLATLYHLPAHFLHEMFPNSREPILLLANAAEMYGCESVMKLPIDNHLHENRSQVLDLCATEPVRMCELAKALKSRRLFVEASIALIGSSQPSYAAKQPKLAKHGLDRLFDQKRAQFVEKLRVCELALFQLQPRMEDEDDLESNLAVIFFRQWLSQELLVKKARI